MQVVLYSSLELVPCGVKTVEECSSIVHSEQNKHLKAFTTHHLLHNTNTSFPYAQGMGNPFEQVATRHPSHQVVCWVPSNYNTACSVQT